MSLLSNERLWHDFPFPKEKKRKFESWFRGKIRGKWKVGFLFAWKMIQTEKIKLKKQFKTKSSNSRAKRLNEMALHSFKRFSTFFWDRAVTFMLNIRAGGEETIYISHQLTLSISSRLIIKAPKQRRWLDSGIFIVNFEQTLHLFLVFLWLILNICL